MALLTIGDNSKHKSKEMYKFSVDDTALGNQQYNCRNETYGFTVRRYL